MLILNIREGSLIKSHNINWLGSSQFTIMNLVLAKCFVDVNLCKFHNSPLTGDNLRTKEKTEKI